tara:strand:- start:573 stop:917 length:345 start_codon:yes stop_codon:yes gene_type:complete
MMEATVLLKIIEETDKQVLSFDMDDFDFLWHTACAAIYWEEEQEGRFEEFMDQEPPTTAQKGWNMYWMDERISALVAYKIALSAGYEAYLLWDTGLNNWCVLTDHGAEAFEQIP